MQLEQEEIANKIIIEQKLHAIRNSVSPKTWEYIEFVTRICMYEYAKTINNNQKQDEQTRTTT